MIIEDFELSEIESIECVGDTTTVDITVEDTHMFFANDIYTHNSGFLNEINDIQAIGKAIEPFQVADMVMTFAQPAAMASENKCILLLLKNRLGPKNIVLECFYDPNQGVFRQLSEVPELLLMSEKKKTEVKATVTSVREKLRLGDFDGKKK